MKLSPSTIAANLSAAAAAEAEAAQANSNTTMTLQSSNNNQTNSNMQTLSTLNQTNSAQIMNTSSAATIPPSSSHHPNSSSSSGGTNQVNSQQLNQQQQQQQQPQQQQSNSLTKCTPKDSQVIAAIIEDLGINDFEPRVLPQLVEFAYRYVARVLEDAQLFSSYAQKKFIDSDDVSLALQMQLNRTFIGPPSRDVLLEISRNKNSQPLPPIKSHNGMRLPADRYSLVAPNFALVTDNKSTATNQPASTINSTKPTIVRSVSSLLTGNTFMSSKTSSSPGISNKTTSQQLNPINTNSNNNNNNDMIFGTKRRLEET